MSDALSQFDVKNPDEKGSSIVEEHRRGGAMSGPGQLQGAGGTGGYPTHHQMPPTVPTPTPTSSLRLPPPTTGPPSLLPPPAAWRHSAQATGLGALTTGTGLHSYFDSPHHLVGGVVPGSGVRGGSGGVGGLPTRGAGGLPPVVGGARGSVGGGGVGGLPGLGVRGGVMGGASPLFSLQMLVAPDAHTHTQAHTHAHAHTAAAAALDYQQETMDLSSQQKKDAHAHAPLSNGGILSNGQVVDAVSVIAPNPLREREPQQTTTTTTNTTDNNKILNCSSKNGNAAPEVVRQQPASDADAADKVDKASPLPAAASPEPATAPSPSPVSPEEHSPPVITTTTTMTPTITEHQHHTADNVESILESMFRIQEEKSPAASAATSVVTSSGSSHSVIVANDIRQQNDATSKDSTPASPPDEKINEQKLIELLKVDEPEKDESCNSIAHKVEEGGSTVTKTDVDDGYLVKDEKVEPPVSNDSSEVRVDETKDNVKDLVVSKQQQQQASSCSSPVVVAEVKENDLSSTTIVISESEDESCIATRESALSSQMPATAASLKFQPPASSSSSSSCRVKDEPAEESDNMFTEVETELEKMFAGIVETGSDGMPGAGTGGGKSAVVDEKKPKRGRPKGTIGGSRRSSDTSFSGVDSVSPKKKKAKMAQNDAKKVRMMEASSSGGGSDSWGAGRKGRPAQSGGGVGGGGESRLRGPVVHLQGSRDNPTSVVVVNSGSRGANDEDDASGEKSGVAKVPFRKQRAILQQEAKTRQGGGLYSSTLSLRYDSATPDSTWLCVLCKRGPHYESSAGDLFGPYVIELPPTTDTSATPSLPSDQELVDEQRRRGGGVSNRPASLRATAGGCDAFVQKVARKKRLVSCEDEASMLGVVGVAGEAGSYEVWVHEDCAVWAPGVTMIGHRLIGLQDAVQAAIKTRCSDCGEPGACIGCITRGCMQLLHYGCAKRQGWLLDQQNFISKCRAHAAAVFGRR